MTGVVLHSVALFAFLWLTMRIVGKRELSQLSAFDLVLVVVLGDLVTEAVLGEDTSLTTAVTAVSTFALLTVAASWASWRWPRRRDFFEGVPTPLISQGDRLEEAMAIERVNLDDLKEAARAQGHRNLDEVEWAVLETDGSFSFLPKSSGQSSGQSSGKESTRSLDDEDRPGDQDADPE